MALHEGRGVVQPGEEDKISSWEEASRAQSMPHDRGLNAGHALSHLASVWR